jgi:serine/threonine protein kinase
MPISIGVQGGPRALGNIEDVSQEKALEALQQIHAHLSEPGRDSGTLTLFNRTKAGSEMTLARKSGFQLLFSDKRLTDTVTAMKGLLAKAGKHDAIAKLDAYLKGGNRIEAGKMREILQEALQPPGDKGGDKGVSGRNPEAPDDRLAPPEVRKPEEPGIDPAKELQAKDRAMLDDFYKARGIDKGKRAGGGAFGGVFLASLDGRECAFKELDKPEVMTLTRSNIPFKQNELIASFLTSKKHPELLEQMNITQPTHYLVSVEKGGKWECQLMEPREARALVKSGVTVRCHGLVMPKADGEDMGAGGTKMKPLSDLQRRQFIRGALQGVKALNARGFVHRDIKPANIFFDPESGKTTFVDTGTMFKTSKNDPQSRFIEGPSVGSLPWAHPRAANDQPHGTERDLYAVGIMTLELSHSEALAELKKLDRNGEGISADLLVRSLEENPSRISAGKRPALEALLRDIKDPKSLGALAMECFKASSEEAESWAKREWSQGAYSLLLQHESIDPSQWTPGSDAGREGSRSYA